jgi:hypothetical protein
VQIVKILDATIGDARFHGRFELLQDGFARIGADDKPTDYASMEQRATQPTELRNAARSAFIGTVSNSKLSPFRATIW